MAATREKKSKASQIREYLTKHPNATMAEVQAALPRHTVHSSEFTQARQYLRERGVNTPEGRRLSDSTSGVIKTLQTHDKMSGVTLVTNLMDLIERSGGIERVQRALDLLGEGSNTTTGSE